LETIRIHPVNPEARLIQQVSACLQRGGLIAYPTDSSYAFGWMLGNKDAQERVIRIRQTDRRHNFTVVCSDLSQIATFAKVSNSAYRLLKAHTPGPYTFILRATREVPRRLRNSQRRSVGIRVPDHPIAHALLRAVNGPLMSSTLMLPERDFPLTEIEDFPDQHAHYMDLLIDGGPCNREPTTVIDLLEPVPVVLRQGRGDASFLQ